MRWENLTCHLLDPSICETNPLSIELLCVYKLLKAVSYRKIKLLPTNREKMSAYWKKEKLDEIYRNRGGLALDSAKSNNLKTRQKTTLIKYAIRLSKWSIIILFLTVVLLFLQKGEQILIEKTQIMNVDGGPPAEEEERDIIPDEE